MDECICWNKANEEKEIYEDILGKEILARKWERKGDLLKIFTCSYNLTTAFLYIIPYYS